MNNALFQPNAHQIAIREHLVQTTITHDGRRVQQNVIDYALQHGYNPGLINAITQVQVPAYINHIAALNIQDYPRTTPQPGVPIHSPEQRQRACEENISQLCADIMDQQGDIVYLKYHRVDNPNNIMTVPLYGGSADNNVNEWRATLNLLLNPEYLPNMLENMAYFTNRPAHFAWSDGCHAVHLQESWLEINHNDMNRDLQVTPINIIDFVQGANQMSDFTDPNANNGMNAMYGPMEDLDSPPGNNHTNNPYYRSWLHNNEVHPTPTEIETRIHPNKYEEQVTRIMREHLLWPQTKIDAHWNRVRGKYCLIPGNWQDEHSRCSQAPHFNKQSSKLPDGETFHQIRIDNAQDLFARCDEMMQTQTRVSTFLQSGNYGDDEVYVEGQHVYGFSDVGKGFTSYYYHGGKREYNDPVDGREFNHGMLMHFILHSDLESVRAQPLEPSSNGVERVIRWKFGVPTYATYHIVGGHPTAPFTGATFICFGKCYRPHMAEVYTIARIP